MSELLSAPLIENSAPRARGAARAALKKMTLMSL